MYAVIAYTTYSWSRTISHKVLRILSQAQIHNSGRAHPHNL